MESHYYLPELIRILSDMVGDGYNYGTVNEGTFEGVNYLYFCADDCGGYVGVDYDSAEEVGVDEIIDYANRGQAPASGRLIMHIEHKEGDN